MEEKEKIENPAAFPVIGGNFPDDYAFNEGMTLRDYFAAKNAAAMVSTIHNDEDYKRARNIARIHDFKTVSEWIAFDSYKQADAMLKERMKQK